MSMFIVLSTLVVLLIFYGLSQRHNRAVHVPVMSAAFAADVVLVLAIELSRQAVEKAVTHVDNGLLMFHVAVSLLSLVMYIALTLSGRKLLRGEEAVRPLHQKMAGAFLLFRLSNYVTSFWVINNI